MYHIEFVKPISQRIRRVTRDYFEILNEILPVTHNLPIFVLPMEYLVYEHPKCLGRFHWDIFTCQIELAGKQTNMEEYKDTICHEYVHYVQWQEGQIVGERGVKVKAKNLVQQVENQLQLSI